MPDLTSHAVRRGLLAAAALGLAALIGAASPARSHAADHRPPAAEATTGAALAAAGR
jgi:hypothetical protein